MRDVIRKTNSRGQGVIEYALLLVLFSIVVLLTLRLFGITLQDTYQGIVDLFRQDAGEKEPLGMALNDLGEWKPYNFWFFNGSCSAQGSGIDCDDSAMYLLKGYLSDDYTISLSGIDVGVTGNAWQGFGIMFRSTEGSYKKGVPAPSGYSFEIQRQGSGYNSMMYFSRWTNGYQSAPLARVPIPQDFDWSLVQDMTIEVSDNTFTAYINGEAVVQATDDTYSQGMVGIVTNAGSGISATDFTVIEH